VKREKSSGLEPVKQPAERRIPNCGGDEKREKGEGTSYLDRPGGDIKHLLRRKAPYGIVQTDVLTRPKKSR